MHLIGSGKISLTGRIQRVVIKDSVSVDKELDFGVRQGVRRFIACTPNL